MGVDMPPGNRNRDDDDRDRPRRWSKTVVDIAATVIVIVLVGVVTGIIVAAVVVAGWAIIDFLLGLAP